MVIMRLCFYAFDIRAMVKFCKSKAAYIFKVERLEKEFPMFLGA